MNWLFQAAARNAWFRAAAAGFLICFLPALACAETPLPRFSNPNRRLVLEKAFPEIEKIFEDFRVKRGVPGLVFGVVVDGELVFVKGLGVRDRAANDPVTPDTVFRIASMTKSFTALAVLKLRDERRLSLEDPVSKWIPEFGNIRYPTRDTVPVRIRQLLTHGAGLPEDNPWGDRQLAISDEVLARWLAAGLPFSTPPDTEFEYSNYGFALLGQIVSRASGMPYDQYLGKAILAPLGMRATTLEPSAVPANVRATGYRKSGQEYTEEPPLPHGAFGAMGGLLTSSRDLARYVAFHLSAWPPRDEPERGPVRRASLREMHHPWRLSLFRADRREPGAPLRAFSSAYAYGLSAARDCRFNHIVGHAGGLPGFGSYMAWLPDYGVGLFAMANLTYAAPSQAVDEALDALRRTGALEPRELPTSAELIAMRDAIVRLWGKWDQKEADAIAADNFFLDLPAPDRREQIDEIKAMVGECRQAGDVRPLNLLRGEFRLSCDRGFVEVFFTLAPTMPPKLQYLSFTEAARLSTKAQAAVRAHLKRVRNEYGSCRAGETLAGDGKTWARVRLECARGPVDLELRLDARGKVTRAEFHQPPDKPCAP